MIGPVLYQELLLGSRRNRAYYFRWCYAGWILLQLSGTLLIEWMFRLRTRGDYNSAALAESCRGILDTLIAQHYLVLLIVTPVLTAGAITDEKWRGTLQYLLVTELFSWEILLGKLIARLYQVFLIALTPLPIICFAGVFGGLDLGMLLCLGLSSMAMAFGMGSMSLLASVLSRNTRDAVLRLYLFIGIVAVVFVALHGVASGTPPRWITWLDAIARSFNPILPSGGSWVLDDAGQRVRQTLVSILAWCILGALSLALASLRLRSAYLSYLENSESRSWLPVLIAFTLIWAVFGLIILASSLMWSEQLRSNVSDMVQQPAASTLPPVMLAWVVGGLLLLLLVIGVLRLAGRSQAVLRRLHDLRERSWFTRRAQLAGDPIRWRERNVEGIAPLAILRALPRWLGVLLVMIATSATSLGILVDHLSSRDSLGSVVEAIRTGDLAALIGIQSRMHGSEGEFFAMGWVVMLVASLIVAIRCSGAVTGEREKSTWEALLLTPLDTKELIRGKLWGVVGAALPYLAAFAIPAIVFSSIGGWLALLLTVLSLGVTLLAMVFVGTAGLWCSVRSRSSWKSLLGTLGITYIGGFLLFCMTTPLIYMVAILLFVMLAFMENWIGGSSRGFAAGVTILYLPAMCFTLAATFAFVAWRFVRSAEYRVGILERTKHWRNEPKHPRWSRHAREMHRER